MAFLQFAYYIFSDVLKCEFHGLQLVMLISAVDYFFAVVSYKDIKKNLVPILFILGLLQIRLKSKP